MTINEQNTSPSTDMATTSRLHVHQETSQDFFSQAKGLDEFFALESLLSTWQQTFSNLKHSYATAADEFIDEFLATASEKQLNELLYTYVTQNLSFLHELKLQLHDGWMRLSCVADVLGIYLNISSDFELVHLQMDKHVQRIVLKQISDTRIHELHTRLWFLAPLIRFGVGAYRKILRKDPLAFILNLVAVKGAPFVDYKGDIIYLEIGRYINKVKFIMDKLPKAQINQGVVKHQELVLKIQPNFAEILSFGNPNADIITADDNPNKHKKPSKHSK